MRKLWLLGIGSLIVLLVAGIAVILTTPEDPASEKPTVEPSEPVSPPPVKPDPALTEADLRAKPNILEVLVDDMRYDDFQYMPFLRSLMEKEGRFLANGFSNYPLCCPARASFLTGQLPHNHKVYHVNDAYGYGSFDDRRTLATSLKSAGYSTGFLGKYLNNYGKHHALAPIRDWEENGRRGPKPQVESQYYSPAGWDEWRAGLQGQHCTPACGGEYSYFNYAYSKNGVPTEVGRGRYSTDFLTEEAAAISRKFTRKRERKGNPFFISLNYVAPHNGGGDPAYDPKLLERRAHPCNMKQPSAPAWAYESPLVKNAVPMGVNRRGLSEKDVGDKVGKWRERPQLTKCVREAHLNHVEARAAAVYAVDVNLKRLVGELRKQGQWKNTVFLFWSDNGFFQGELRLPAGKSSVHEPSLRVPMFLTGPGLRTAKGNQGVWGGQDYYSPVDVVDLTATLLDFAQAEAPHHPDGQSFKPNLLANRDPGFRRTVVYESALTDADPAARASDRVYFHRKFDGEKDPRKTIGIRTGRYTFARYDNGEFELYDNWRDPKQWHNLANNSRWLSKHGRVVQQLEQLLKSASVCQGWRACQQTLPKNLQVTADRLKRTTRDWYGVMARLHQN